MAIDVASRTKDELVALIANHEEKGATSAPLYTEALAELERRTGKGLNFEKSFLAILEAAKGGRFMSYKELADASNAEWTAVHYSVGRHLGALVTYAHHKGWPLLSSIVVNKPNVDTGEMEPDTLRGFIGIARKLGYPVLDEVKFLRDQQDRVFAWAISHDGSG